MTGNQISTFIGAVEDAGLKTFQLVTDMSTNLWNNESGIIKVDGDLVVAYRKALFQNTNTVNGVEIVAADAADIHEARVMGPAEKIKEIGEALGAALSDDEYKMLISLDKQPVDLFPITGDYNTFYFKTADEYAAMSDDNKAKYDKAKMFDEVRLPSFGYMSDKQYDAMSDEDKAAYDEIKARYDAKVAKYTGMNQAAQISLF